MRYVINGVVRSTSRPAEDYAGLQPMSDEDRRFWKLMSERKKK